MPSQYGDRLGKVAMFQALRLYLEYMKTVNDCPGSWKGTPLSMISPPYSLYLTQIVGKAAPWKLA